MKRSVKWLLIILALIVVIIMMISRSFVGAYNTIQDLDEKQSSAAAEMINQYKRRADLITNLANTVKGYSQHEQAVFSDIAAARAAMGQLNVTPESFQSATMLQNFDDMQSKIGSALSRLLVVVEKYPDLKANALYRDLMAQLEGTENRIAVARNRYIEAVRIYNTTIRKVPHVFLANMFGYQPLPQFSVNDSNIDQPPVIAF